MSSDDLLPIEFAENPEPRVPVLLLLDVSGSMSGAPLQSLNDGLQTFEPELKKDPLVCQRVELAVMTFGGDVEVVHSFSTVDSFTPPVLSSRGDTPMGRALHEGLDLLEDRLVEYETQGTPKYRPLCFLFTDGAPTDGWKRAAKRLATAEAEKRVAFFAIGTQGANFDILQQLSSQRAPVKLEDLNFVGLFKWMSKGFSSIAGSAPGEQAAFGSTDDWGTIQTGTR